MATFNSSHFRQQFHRDGYAIVPNLFEPGFVQTARAELERAIEKEALYHGKAHHKDFGMVLLCALYGGPFWTLFDEPNFVTPFHEILGPGCIVYAYTSSSLPPQIAEQAGRNYSTRIHVDCPRLIPNYITNMGAIVLLNDFTSRNGATLVLPRSQWDAAPPDAQTFRQNAVELIAPAGSVAYFNARLWHASQPNQTDQWRHALTVNICRPYMKQRIDIPRSLAQLDLSTMSETTRQKFGFYAQVPASYDEYYRPPEQRLFRQPAE